MRRLVIAIDGPAASGKSTTARLVARRLGYLHIDTGAMYRAVTLKVIRSGVRPEDRGGVEQLTRSTSLRLEPGDQRNVVYLDGEDVTDEIRRPSVTNLVSLVSSYPGVREVMVREQRKAAAPGGAVLEGRDIGTVVLPDADLKFYIIADDRERARRRVRELSDGGVAVAEEDILSEIRTRDDKDSSREASPLRRAADAIEIDTTHLSIEQQVEKILNIVEQRQAQHS